MAFRFSLKALLRIRASYERLERLRLLAITAMIVRIRERVAELDRQGASAAGSRQERLRAGTAAIELQLEIAQDKLRNNMRQELLDRLAALEKQQTRQMRIYRLARQRHQIVESLRDRRFANY